MFKHIFIDFDSQSSFSLCCLPHNKWDPLFSCLFFFKSRFCIWEQKALVNGRVFALDGQGPRSDPLQHTHMILQKRKNIVFDLQIWLIYHLASWYAVLSIFCKWQDFKILFFFMAKEYRHFSSATHLLMSTQTDSSTN